MESRFLSQAAKFLQEQKKNKRWTVVFVCLAAVVALGTVTALKLYGQAMTHKVKVLNCGYEVHTHDEGCYDEDGNLTCVYADYVVHVHNDDCYDANSGELVCQIPEREPHEHTDECYEEEEVLVCGKEESKGEDGHKHTDECYTKEKGDLICEIEGHTHDDSCYSETLVCEKEEHTHDDGCYEKVLDCDDDSEDHEHGDGCYKEELTCGKEEHTHGEGCYEKTLTCEAAEESHEHTDECYEWKDVLTCTSDEDEGEEGHVHTDECYETRKVLTCGELELHTHDDSCYEEDCFDEDGNLIEGSVPTCGLLQLEEHVHSGDCFETIELTADEIAALNAGAVLHIHVDSCYDENGNLICGHDATHIHNTECYDADGNLICGYAGGHTHDETCYDENGKLICGQKETAHIHTKECYDEDGNLICGEKEKAVHEHGRNCYDENGNLICGHEDAKDHEHDVECYDADDNLICGYEGMKDHRHTAECYDEDGNLICERIIRAHVHEDSCYDADGNLICGYEEEYHIHTPECYDEDGSLICGYINGDSYENTVTYEGDGYLVTAMYNNDAELPEGAELIAEQITAESDEERYAQREAEYQQMMEDDKASMRALFKIGFYVEGEEVEPKTPVAVTIQFLDEDGLAEGKPITVVHFAEEGAKKLDSSSAKDGSTSFRTDGFSEFAIGYSVEKKIEIDENGVATIDSSFKYDADPFHITFQVKGEAKTVDGEPVIEDTSDDETAGEGGESVEEEGTVEEGEAGETEVTISSRAASTKIASVASQEVSAEGTPDTSEEGSGPVEDTEGTGIEAEGGAEAEGDSSTDTAEDPNSKLEFKVEELENTEIRDAVLGYFGDTEESATRRVLHTLSYKLFYDGQELDLSQCKVTATITMGAAPAEEITDPSADEAETDTTPDADVSEGTESTEGGQEDAEASENTTAENDAQDSESMEPTPEDGNADEGGSEETEETSQNGNVGSSDAESSDNGAENVPSDGESNVEVIVTALEVAENKEVHQLGTLKADGDDQSNRITATLNSNVMAFSSASTVNPIFTVQYYAYAQVMETEKPNNAEAIPIIDTCLEEGVEGRAQLPQNASTPKTRNMYVSSTGKSKDYGEQTGNGKQYWEIYEPVYKNRENGSTDSLTKLYLNEQYEFKEVANGLDHINKFKNIKIDPDTHFELYEVWVLEDPTKVDAKTKTGWKVYSGKAIENLQFTNNSQVSDQDGVIGITDNTVIRLVGKSNTKDHNYPARFFDYDFTNGTNEHELQGINNPANYKKDSKDEVIKPRYGFGNNSSGRTGLVEDTLGGYWINQAKKGAKSIIQKCSYGIVESSLSEDGYPQIKANAPDLFGPQTPESSVSGKTEISGYSLNFKRDGDTYTLTSVAGSGDHAQNLDQFQKGVRAYYAPSLNVTNPDQIWTNQFWPMDNASTFGAPGHDPKFGTKDQKESTGLAVADDGHEHNSFFGMTFEVEFELTEDYVGPLNYYFFGDDDMWVFLEHPNGDTELICDIGGVHQAAGEYVDLWNYIQKPQEGSESTKSDTEEERPKEKYKLKFFYTERGASGSTCWMQFTLPSVNAVPVIDYTGNVKSTLKLGKTVEGDTTNKIFDFQIKFTGDAANISFNNYPYIITHSDGSKISGEIRSDGIFKLGHDDSIEIFNLPNKTEYIITELNNTGYKPALGPGSVGGMVTENETVEGNIDWSRNDELDYINQQVSYELPETGGPGMELYTIAGALCLVFGAGFLYRKKFRERRA